MLIKKAKPAEIAAAKDSLVSFFGEVTFVEDVPVKEYMLKWLSAFAPDMTVYDAKSFCLPKLFFKNYLWNAFSFQKTDCYVEEDAEEAFANGFEGPCYVLLNGENVLCKIADGSGLTPENVKAFSNIIIFTEDFSKTYVHTGNEEFGPYYKSADLDEDFEEIDPDDFVVEESEEEEE